MLDRIRMAIDTWIAKFLLAVLLLCFALIWGAPELIRTKDTDIFTSGRSVIKDDAYQYTLNDFNMRTSVSLGKPNMMNREEALQYGLPRFVADKMRQDVLLDEQARLMKIGLSKDSIAAAIGRDRFFSHNDAFDPSLFKNYTAYLRASQSDAINQYEGQEKRNQLVRTIKSGVQVPKVFLEAYQLYQNQTRAIDFITLTPDVLGAPAAPTDEQLNVWFLAHKEEFRTPEYRTFSYMQMTEEDLIQSQNITEQEIADYYDNNQARFTQPEKRTLDELQFKTREEADQARSKLDNGVSFDELVKEQQTTLEKIRKKPVTKNELPDALASEVFNLDNNATSNIIDGVEGPVIVRMVHSSPSQIEPLKNVENEIRQALAKISAANAMRSNRSSIDDARFEGRALDELAKKYNLPHQQVTTDATGKTQQGQTLDDLPQKNALVDTVFQAVVGMNGDPITIPQKGYVWYNLENIIPARDQTLEEVKQTVTERWINDETKRLLKAKTAEIQQQLNAAKTLDNIAHELNLNKKSARNLQRGKSLDFLGNAAVDAAFSQPVGGSGIVSGPTPNTRIIYQITDSIDPLSVDPKFMPKDAQNRISESYSNDAVQAFLAVANQENPVMVNAEVYNRLMSGSF